MSTLSLQKNRLAIGLASLLIAACAIRAAGAGSVADLDLANGIPEARIGSPVDAFRGSLQLVEDTGRWLTYKPPGDKLQYAGFPVTGMKYNFFKGKLYSIDIDVLGRKSTKGILKTLEKDFGTTYTLETNRFPKTDTDLETREWTGAKIYLLYKSAANEAGATMIFLDRPTWDLLQIPKKERAAANRAMLDGSFVNGDF